MKIEFHKEKRDAEYFNLIALDGDTGTSYKVVVHSSFFAFKDEVLMLKDDMTKKLKRIIILLRNPLDFC